MDEVSELEPSMNDSQGLADIEAATPEPDDDLGRIERIVESVLFAAAAPVSLRRLVDILDGPTAREMQAAITRLKEHYGPRQRGIQLVEVAGGYQFRTARENAEWVRAVFRDKPARLGRAALETLAIVAYKQPVTRAEIEVIRGVEVDGVLNTLLARQLVKISGRKETVGRPLLYTTTPEFLETFGLKELSELPSLKELGPAPDGEDSVPTSDAEPHATGAAAPAGPAPVEASPAPEPTGTAAAVAEDSEPGGDCLAAEGGDVDPGGSGAGERPSGDPAGDEGTPADGSDHD
jgi:segregation and condensation protein B